MNRIPKVKLSAALPGLIVLAAATQAQAAASFVSYTGLGNAPYVTAYQDPAAPKSTDDLMDALKNSTPFLDMRYRYEYADQSNLTHESHANTLATIGGFQTSPFYNFRVALGAENVMAIGSDNNYNNSVNSLSYPKVGSNQLSKYPKIGDPGDTLVQLANVQWLGLPQTSVTAGRQYLVIDNQRWIGTSQWRQIRQNFDAVTAKNGSIPDFEFLYSYIFQVNRAPGTDSELGVYQTHTNVFHATYTGVPGLKISPYVYLFNIGNVSTLSNKTIGTRGEYLYSFNPDFAASGVAEYANQSNYGNNPADFDVNYFTVEPGVIVGQDKGPLGSLTGKVGYEKLGGNGHQAVQTPEASNHIQNGWDDMFATTPNTGLSDSYLSGAYKYQFPIAGLAPTKLQTDWHVFHSDVGGMHFGNELDADLT